MELTRKNYKRTVIDAAHKFMTHVLFLIAFLAAIMCLIMLLAYSSSDDPNPNPNPSATANGTLNVETADIFNQVRDKDRNLPLQNDELLYAANTYQLPIGFLKPIKAPMAIP